MKYFIVYLIGINILAFILYAIDKVKAKLGMRRIKEKSLLMISLLGGAYAGILSMFIFHHKIRKRYFIIINIIGVILYTSIIGGYLWK